MCVIIDANMWSDFLNKEKNMKPVHKWMESQKGKLVYSNHKAFQKELTKDQKTVLRRYYQAGKARLVPEKQVDETIKSLKENNTFRSNDIHILALAKARRVKVLCTKDTKLHYDFKHILGGRIYQKEKHKNLLTQDICP